MFISTIPTTHTNFNCSVPTRIALYYRPTTHKRGGMCGLSVRVCGFNLMTCEGASDVWILQFDGIFFWIFLESKVHYLARIALYYRPITSKRGGKRTMENLLECLSLCVALI